MMIEDKRIIELLTVLAHELRTCNEQEFAVSVESAASGTDDQRQAFLISNQLWGGAGSIADQAGVRGERGEQRKAIERVLRDLGREQIRLELVNPRTSMWVDTFTQWVERGL